MEKYIEPEMELVTFDSEDVITTSGGNCKNGGFGSKGLVNGGTIPINGDKTTDTVG